MMDDDISYLTRRLHFHQRMARAAQKPEVLQVHQAFIDAYASQITNHRAKQQQFHSNDADNDQRTVPETGT
jgi:hypothetical protein